MNYNSFYNLNQNRLNLTSDELYTVNLLNNMYNNNNRIIDGLVNSNNELRVLIQRILQQSMQNNSRASTGQSRNQRARQRENNNVNSLFEPSLNMDTPLIIDYIQPGQFTRFLERFLDPVQIYPTQEQIENATSIIRYGDIETPLNNSCPISLEPFNENDSVSIIRYCGHIFKTEQLQAWFQTNVRCPVCRYDIRRYVQPSASSSSSSYSFRHEPTRASNDNEDDNDNDNDNANNNNRQSRVNETTPTQPIPSIRTTRQSNRTPTFNTRALQNLNNNNQINQLITSFLSPNFLTDLSNNSFV